MRKEKGERKDRMGDRTSPTAFPCTLQAVPRMHQHTATVNLTPSHNLKIQSFYMIITVIITGP